MMNTRILVCVLALLVGACAALKTRYDGNEVLHVHQAHPAQVQKLEHEGFDIWAVFPSKVTGQVAFDVMVNSAQKKHITRLGLDYEVKIPDVQTLIDQETEMMEKGASASWYDVYHPFAEIVTRIEDLAKSYPSLVTYIPSIGKTVQGRDIPAFSVNSGAATVNRSILIIGGLHAREWVAPATTLYVAEKLITLYSTDSSVKQILDRVAFEFIPVSNPDGYLFSWSTTRLWRKNRRANTGGSFGVDLNRNFDDHFGEQGVSLNPTSETYPGTGPFSEPESLAVARRSNATKYNAAVDFHSYSQLVLRPPDWSRTTTPDETLLRTVGAGIVDSILAVNRVRYTNQIDWELYLTSGTSDNWWYSKAKITLSYCIELRDTGNYGFVLPPAQIIPTGEENYAGIKYLANYVLSH